MKTSTLAASPLGAPFDLLTEQGTEGAIIEISHSATSDSLDGQPWPPSESDVLWVIVRRTSGLTLWRSIQLAQVQFAVTDFCNSPIGSARN